MFILCAEILANAVRNDSKVRGIKVFDTECKISQYADDTTFILDGSQSSFSRSLYLLDTFALMSGLKVNYDKTEALWIGSRKGSQIIFPSGKPILWADEKVYALGVWLSTSVDKQLKANFMEKIIKLESILNSWAARRLTLLGKITIIKSLAVSQIVYLLSALPCPQGILQKINSLLYDFLWGSKSEKIKRTEMINEYDKGGLKMIDIHSFNASLKIKWVQSYLNTDNKGKWKSVFDYYLRKHGGKLLFQGNLKKQDIPLLDIREPFLREIAEQWTNINFTEKNPDFISSCIWHNSLIRIESRPFFYRTWFNAGVEVVGNLLDKEGNFLSYNNFISKFNIKTNYLEYYKIISTVTQYKKVCSPALGDNAKADNENLLAHSKICKKVYQHLIEKKASIPLKSQNKWLAEAIISENLNINWKKTYFLAFLCTKETKLREFQFILLHRRIATNDFLHKIGLKPNDSCTFCGETTENLIHLFWKCKHSWTFWEETHRWICQNVNGLESDTFSAALCLGIVDDIGDLLLHHALLIARYYIHTCRLRNTLPKLQYIQKKS